MTQEGIDHVKLFSKGSGDDPSIDGSIGLWRRSTYGKQSSGLPLGLCSERASTVYRLLLNS